MKLSKTTLDLISEYGDYYSSQISQARPARKSKKGKILAGGLLAGGLGYAAHKYLKKLPKQSTADTIEV